MGFGERLGVMGLTKVKQGQVVRLCSIKSDSTNLLDGIKTGNEQE